MKAKTRSKTTTKTGKRTAHFGVQIVENPNNITLFFDGHDFPPIIFSAKTGQSGKKAHGKLKKILKAVEAEGETMAATKTAAKAVTAAVKTASKEAVKAVADRAGKADGS
jgi:hypothetical protein